MSVPIYLAECAPTQHRGAIITVNNLSITGGQLVAALTCAVLADVNNGWRWMLGTVIFENFRHDKFQKLEIFQVNESRKSNVKIILLESF